MVNAKPNMGIGYVTERKRSEFLVLLEHYRKMRARHQAKVVHAQARLVRIDDTKMSLVDGRARF